MGRKYYVIDSLKGGCGKTTFSIMLSQFLEEINKKAGKEEHVCLLDFDFLGTGLINIFLPREIQEEKYANEYRYITEKIRNFKSESFKYIYKCQISSENLEGKAADFYIGFGDPYNGKKTGYRLAAEFNHMPAVNYGVFRKGILDILSEDDKNLEEQIEGTVNSVVLDMSPGMDSYSETVKECLFDRKHTIVTDESRTYYFLMMGMDFSHISAAQNYFYDFISDDGKMPDKIFIVINDPMKMGEKLGDEKTNYNATAEEFKKSIDEKLNAEYRSRIYFLVLNHFEGYAKLTHNRIALCGNRKDKEQIFLDSPIRYWAPWETAKMREIGTNEEKLIEKDLLIKCLTE